MLNQWAAELKDTARWIWHSHPLRYRHDFALFYSQLEAPPGTAEVRLHASADSRYILYADSGGGVTRLGRGPARSDTQHTSLDPYAIDLSGPAVRLWAAVRWTVGLPYAPVAEMHSHPPGFLLIATFHDAAGKLLGKAGTDKNWKVRPCHAIAALPAPPIPSCWLMGDMEEHHSALWPSDWLSPTALNGTGADGQWEPALERNPAYFRGDPPYSSDDHFLIPREIPQPYESPTPFAAIADAATGLPQPLQFPLKIAPNATASYLLDAGVMRLAYPRLALKGPGSSAAIYYSEVLREAPDFDKPKHFTIPAGPLPPASAALPARDLFHLDHADPHQVALYEPFHWRSFRFARIDITAGPAGAEWLSADMLLTGYPFDYKYTFAALGPHAKTIKDFVDVSWRTIQCCTWETYMDCPFYEQLQYVGDTRLQVLCTYVATGDPTLPAQALRAFDRSRADEGLTQSRYPSLQPQWIPTFSLIYILMIDDYLTHTGDDGLTAELRPGIAPILNWFTRYIDPRTGLIGEFPFWPFVDWVHGWPAGVPLGSPNSILNLTYLQALDAAARIYESSKPGAGEIYLGRANALRQKIYDTFYDSSLGILRDEPKSRPFSRPSQHAQTLAVLTNVLKGNEAKRALEIALTGKVGDHTLAPATFYYRFYFAEALAKVGMGAALWTLIEPFRDALARGSTTWPESFEPTRSECHAWSSWPMYFFARHTLGVHPPDPNTGRIVIKPLHCPPLDTVSGTVMTHRGPVHVSVQWQNGKPKIQAEGPNVYVTES